MARQLQLYFLSSLKARALNVKMPKLEWKAGADRDYEGGRRIVEKRLQKRERNIVIDMIRLRQIKHSIKMISHPQGHIFKLQKERAGALIVKYLRKSHEQKQFFDMMKESIHLFLKIQRGLKFAVVRKMHKKQMLREYWQAILDRCKLLMGRGKQEMIMKFNGHKLSQISTTQRDNLIDRCVFLQQTRYVERVHEWKQQIRNLKDDYHKKICSRLLKYFMDDYLLNRRTIVEERAIIETCIDAHIPIPDEKINISLKKGKTGKKDAKGSEKLTTRGTQKSSSKETL